jgi:hypothetical protein
MKPSMTRATILSTGLALLAVSRPAWADDGAGLPAPVPSGAGDGRAPAQSWPEPFGLAPTVPPVVHETPPPWGPPSSIGTGLTVGGGLWNFTKSDAYAKTGLGGSWDARLALGTRRIVGAEVAYVGSSSDVKGAGINEDSYLMRNGAEGDLRLSLPLVRGAGLIAPFAFGGLGWNRFVVRNAPDLRGMLRRDDVLVTPVGAGLTISFHTLLLELRYTYRFSFYDDMFPGTRMQTQNVGLNVGAEL